MLHPPIVCDLPFIFMCSFRVIFQLVVVEHVVAYILYSTVDTEVITRLNVCGRLMQVATQTAATDPRTGTIDMDMISTGRSSMDRELIVKLAQECQAFCKQKQGQRVPVNVLRQVRCSTRTASNLSQ